MAVDVPQLLEMSKDELDALFQSSGSGEIPRGEAEGTVLVAPGTELSGPAAKLIHLLVWQGKVFDPEKGELGRPEGDHRPRLLEDVARRALDQGRDPRGLARRLSRARLLGARQGSALRAQVPDLSAPV